MVTARLKLPLAVITATACVAVAYQWWISDDASRTESRRRLASVVLPDIYPGERLRIVGNVKVVGIVGSTERWNSEASVNTAPVRQGCEAICAALLATPGVTSVTVFSVADDGERESKYAATRFMLEPQNLCHGETVMPQNPDALSPTVTRVGSITVKSFDNALAMAWARQLATYCIVAEAPAGSYDLTIAYSRYTRFGPQTEPQDWHWSRDPLSVQVTRLSIAGRGGHVLLRQTIGWTRMIDRPRFPGEVGVAGYATPVIGWLRTILSNQPMVPGIGIAQEVNPSDTILSYTDVDPHNILRGVTVKTRPRRCVRGRPFRCT